MTIKPPFLSERQAKWRACRHNDLQFGSGGHYIFCCECGAQWVACHDGGTIDHNRAGNLVSGFDHRIPGVPILKAFQKP